MNSFERVAIEKEGKKSQNCSGRSFKVPLNSPAKRSFIVPIACRVLRKRKKSEDGNANGSRDRDTMRNNSPLFHRFESTEHLLKFHCEKPSSTHCEEISNNEEITILMNTFRPSHLLILCVKFLFII